MKAIRLDAGLEVVAEGEGPKWNVLLRTGSFHRADFGAITITAADLQTMVRNWKAMGGQALRFDWHHMGDSAPDARRSLEDREASGWIERLEVRPDEPDLLYGLVDWTEKARQKIKAKAYRYLSPEFVMDMPSRSTGKRQGPTFLAAGLLNDPFLTDLPRVAASAVAVPPAQPNPAPKAKEQHMNPIAVAALAALGLPETATEADVAAAHAKLTAKDAEAVKLSAAVEPLTVKLSAFDAKIAALEKANAELEKANKNAAVDAALVKLQDRLTTTDEKDAFRKYAFAIGLDEAVKVHGSFPVKVKTGEMGHGAGGGEVTAKDAHVKLSATVAELVKGGTSPVDAWLTVIEKNTEVAALTRETKSV